jgi:hypothetical protein
MNILYILLKIWGHIELFWIQHILPIIAILVNLLPKSKKANELLFIKNGNCIEKTHDLSYNSDEVFDFILLCIYVDEQKYGKIKSNQTNTNDKIEIASNHFTTIQISIDDNSYDIELCNDYINYYVCDNIIDIHVFEYILNKSLNKYNLTIIDSECNIIDGNEKTRILINKDNYSIL